MIGEIVIGVIVLIGIFAFIKFYNKFLQLIKNYKTIIKFDVKAKKSKDKYNITEKILKKISVPHLGNLIGGFIVILVGVNLIGTFTDEVSTLENNITETTGTILNLTTLFFALGIMVVGVALAIGGLRRGGLM